jgi:hypothetical protein
MCTFSCCRSMTCTIGATLVTVPRDPCQRRDADLASSKPVKSQERTPASGVRSRSRFPRARRSPPCARWCVRPLPSRPPPHLCVAASVMLRPSAEVLTTKDTRRRELVSWAHGARRGPRVKRRRPRRRLAHAHVQKRRTGRYVPARDDASKATHMQVLPPSPCARCTAVVCDGRVGAEVLGLGSFGCRVERDPVFTCSKLPSVTEVRHRGTRAYSGSHDGETRPVMACWHVTPTPRWPRTAPRSEQRTPPESQTMIRDLR